MDDINNNFIEQLNDEQDDQDQVELPIEQAITQIIEEKKEQTKKPQSKLYFIPNKDGTLEQIDFGLLLKKAPKLPPKKVPPPPQPQVVKEVVKVKTPEKIIPKKEPTPEPEEPVLQISDEVLWGYNKFNLLRHLKKLQKKHNKYENLEQNDIIQQKKIYIEKQNFQLNINDQTRTNRFNNTNQTLQINKSTSPQLPKINPRQIAWKPGKAIPMTFQQINKIISLSPQTRQLKTPLIHSPSKDKSFDTSKNTIEHKLEFIKQKQNNQPDKPLQFKSAVRKIDYFQKLEFLPSQEQPPQINKQECYAWKPQQLVNKTFIEIQQQFPLKSPKSIKRYDRNLQKIEDNFQIIQNQF